MDFKKLNDQKVYNSIELIEKIIDSKSWCEIYALLQYNLFTTRTVKFKRGYKNGKITFWLEDFGGGCYTITKYQFLERFEGYCWMVFVC